MNEQFPGEDVAATRVDAGDADLDHYFLTPQLEQRLELVQHLVDFSQQVIVITGAAGAGKTLFLTELARRAHANWRLAVLDGNEDTGPEAMIAELAGQMGGPGDCLSVADLGALLAQFQRTDQLGVAIIDNADALPPQCLQMLIDLAQPPADNERLHLVLAGPPALQELLAGDSGGLRLTISHSLDIPPFTPAQTEAFADQLLLTWGVPPSEALQQPQFIADLHRNSRGLPAAIIEQLDRAAAAAAVRPRRPERSMPALAPAHWLVGVGLLIAVAGLWLLLGGDEKPAATTPAVVTLPAARTEPPAVAGVEPPPSTPPALENTPARAEATPPASAPPPLRAEAEPPSAPPQAAGPEVETTPPPRTAAPAPPPEMADGQSDLAATITAAAAGADRKAPTEAKPPAAARTDTAPAAPPSVQATSAKTPQKTAVKQENPPDAGKITFGNVRQDAWIRSQAPERYVLQLFGVHEPERVAGFLGEQPDLTEFAVFRSTYKGRPWFVVTWGLFSDRDAARAAIDQLPASLRGFKPWARSIASIRDSLP